MKLYQIMYHDGYYPDWPMDDRIYRSREAARTAFESDPPLESRQPDYRGPQNAYKLAEREEEYCDYYIAERDLVDVPLASL